jgi:hypothetical protein
MLSFFKSLTGNPVEIGSGPAAVAGDKREFYDLTTGLIWEGWEGIAFWTIRKPEDRPGV